MNPNLEMDEVLVKALTTAQEVSDKWEAASQDAAATYQRVTTTLQRAKHVDWPKNFLQQLDRAIEQRATTGPRSPAPNAPGPVEEDSAASDFDDLFAATAHESGTTSPPQATADAQRRRFVSASRSDDVFTDTQRLSPGPFLPYRSQMQDTLRQSSGGRRTTASGPSTPWGNMMGRISGDLGELNISTVRKRPRPSLGDTPSRPSPRVRERSQEFETWTENSPTRHGSAKLVTDPQQSGGLDDASQQSARIEDDSQQLGGFEEASEQPADTLDLTTASRETSVQLTDTESQHTDDAVRPPVVTMCGNTWPLHLLREEGLIILEGNQVADDLVNAVQELANEISDKKYDALERWQRLYQSGCLRCVRGGQTGKAGTALQGEELTTSRGCTACRDQGLPCVVMGRLDEDMEWTLIVRPHHGSAADAPQDLDTYLPED